MSAAALLLVLLETLVGPLLDVEGDEVGGERVEACDLVVELEAALDEDLRGG